MIGEGDMLSLRRPNGEANFDLVGASVLNLIVDVAGYLSFRYELAYSHEQPALISPILCKRHLIVRLYLVMSRLTSHSPSC